MKKRRNIEVFSLSFLDCICCGFGAIVLLLVLSKLYDPIITNTVSEELSISLKKELQAVKDQSLQIEKDLPIFQKELKDKQVSLDTITSELNEIQGKYDISLSKPIQLEANQEDLEEAKQKLSEEIKNLQPDYRRAANEAIGGIPVDSEYIIFVIDTSGSMQSKWGWAERKLSEVLDVYPTVKGLQIMNDNGRFMFLSLIHI